MKPIEHYLKSNLYARKYPPISAHDFRFAVPPEMPEYAFDMAGVLLSAGYGTFAIRLMMERVKGIRKSLAKL